MEQCDFPVITAQLGGGGKNGGRYLYAWRKYTPVYNQKSSKKAIKLAITRFLLNFKVLKRFITSILSYSQATSFSVGSLPLQNWNTQDLPRTNKEHEAISPIARGCQRKECAHE